MSSSCQIVEAIRCGAGSEVQFESQFGQLADDGVGIGGDAEAEVHNHRGGIGVVRT